MINVPLKLRVTAPIPASQMLVGDALLFDYRSAQTFVERGIRLITGSEFVHIATVEQPREDCTKIVMEAISPRRLFEEVPLYAGVPGDTVVHLLRPKFPVEPLDFTLLARETYGYLNVLDCLLNHAIDRVTLRHWRYRAMLSHLTPNQLDCSALVAKRYQLWKHAPWCTDFRVLEPDDYYNRNESFDYLGQVAWGL